MAYYGNKSDTKPRLTGKICEVCGKLPERKLHKHADANVTISIQSHAQNRIKVDWYYANLSRVNRPDLANKMLCPACYYTLISKPLNS